MSFGSEVSVAIRDLECVTQPTAISEKVCKSVLEATDEWKGTWPPFGCARSKRLSLLRTADSIKEIQEHMLTAVKMLHPVTHEGQQHCRKLTASLQTQWPSTEDALTFPHGETLAPIKDAEGSEISEECPEVSRDVATPKLRLRALEQQVGLCEVRRVRRSRRGQVQAVGPSSSLGGSTCIRRGWCAT